MSKRPLRAASLTAAAVAAASITMIAAPAANAAPPAGDTTLSGVAVVDGAPVADIRVGLYESTAPYRQIGSTRTDATGAYYFDFTTGDTNYASGFVSTTSQATSFKLEYNDFRTLTGDQLGAQDEFYNDRYTIQGALPVAKPATATNATVPTVSLASYSGAKGTPSVPVPAGYTYFGNVLFYDADGNLVAGGSFDNDPTTTTTTEAYTVKGLVPGETYYAQFSATASNATTNEQLNFVSGYYTGARSLSKATPITAAASGQYLQGIQVALTNTFTPVEAPSIEGSVAFGKTVTADPGDWGFEAGNHYSYQWLLNGVPVATGPSYKIDKKAKGKLRLVVTNENTTSSFIGGNSVIGSASSKEVKIGFASKFKAKAKRVRVLGATNVALTGTLKVKAPKKKAAKLAKGKVLVYDTLEDGTLDKVGKARVKAGKLTGTVKGLDRGKHELVVVFKGSKKVASVTDTVKVKL